MRSPVSSETDAFRLTVAGALLVLVSALIGWLSEALIGALVFVGFGVIALAAYLRRPDREPPRPLREAARERHRHGARPGTRHVLVVANAPLDGDELLQRIRGEERAAQVELDVLAPVLTSRVHLAVTDIDDEIAAARRRLERSLAWAHSHSLHARGEVGDASPTTALEDELRAFGADVVIVLTATSDADARQERTELERLREELDVPVVQLAVAGVR